MIGNYHFASDYGCPHPGMPLCRKRSRRNRDAPIGGNCKSGADNLDSLILLPLMSARLHHGSAQKAKGRLLSRAVALSSDFSKVWFGFQTTTPLSRPPARPAGLLPCFPHSSEITSVARAFLVPSSGLPVSRPPRESRRRASRFLLVRSLPLEDCSSVKLNANCCLKKIK
jgi:hypothetical protein